MARFTRWLRQPASSRAALRMEALEPREVPAVITVTSIADDLNTDGFVTLREAILAAETDAAVDGSTAGSGADTIVFDPSLTGQTINLSLVGNNVYGPTALSITSDIIIDGLFGSTGVTIARDGAVTNLRLFHVSASGSLNLQGVTLSGGAAIGGHGGDGDGGGGGAAGLGGAVMNLGSLTVTSVTFSSNTAVGGNGGAMGEDYNGGGGGGLAGSGTAGTMGGAGTGGGPNGGAVGANGGVGGGGGGNSGNGGFGGGGGGGVGGGSNGLGGNGGFGGGGGGGGFLSGIGGGTGYGGGLGGNNGGGGGGGAGLGGAIFNYGGAVFLTNVTFSSNSAIGGTGGGSMYGVAGAAGLGSGGGWFNLSGSVTETGTANLSNLGGNTGTAVTPPTNGNYGVGQHLDFRIHFGEAMTVDTTGGTPTIQLTIGSSTVNATYESGSGTNTLVFRYTVQSGDLDSNGIVLSGPIMLNGGTIQDALTNNAPLTFISPDTTGVLVDSIAPTIVSVTGPTSGTYVAGQHLEFTVNFDEDVTVSGTPRIQLTIGGSTVYADYYSGSGSSTLTFRYTVVSGDLDTNGIASTSPIDLNSGTIRDAATNNAVLTFTLPDTTGVLVDASNPSVTAVSPPTNGAYKAGTNLDFVLTFSEVVNVTGMPRVQLTVGGNVVYATYLLGSGTNTLTFRYIVQPGDTDADGVALGTAIDLNGGTICDGALNGAITTVPSTPTPGVTVDTTTPTATMTSPTPSFTNSSPIPVTVTFSEDVTGFDANDLVVGNATVSNFTMVDGRTYTFNLIPTSDGVVAVGVDGAAVVTDAAGNQVVPPSALTWTFDGTAPTTSVALASNQTAVTGQNTVRFSVTFSEAVNGFDASDVVLGGTATGGQVSVTGSGSSYIVTVSGLTGGGTVTIQVVSAAGTDAIGNPSVFSSVSPEVRYSPVPTGLTTSPVGNGTNGTQIEIRDPQTGAVVNTIDPFPGFRGTVDTSSADVNGDGVADLAVGAGAGGGPHVKVFDGATGAELHSFFAFDAAFTGGVDLAVGDVNGDGVTDLIVAAGAGGGPHVKVFDGRTLDLLASFYAYAPTFAGGVSVATGDRDGDGRAEIITGAASGGSPHVKVFDGLSLAELQSFYAYDPAFGGGVNVAAGDLNGDGRAEIITGAGPGGSPHVKAFNGQTLDVVHSFFAYDAAFLGGVDVAVRDVNSDGYGDIVTGAGPGGGPHVKAFDGRTLDLLQSFFAAEDTFHGGVFVG